MAQKHRISTDIGKDQLIRVELQQEFDILEILSLKFTQKELYTSFCSDYGVVVGRISANNGLGIPNARVSIFIPQSDVDVDDPVISALYPYTDVTDKNTDNYRYNLLPSRQQHGGHAPTGTFFDQSDILNREEILEVFENYYRYTVKTNESGDFMIWGVPVGQQVLHIDVDLSDIGCFSLRPYDFIRQGKGVDNFLNTYKFKSSSDLDHLPQIVSSNKTIQVYPLWGNTNFCEIGITRSDFDLSSMGVKIEPKAFVIGGTMADVGKSSLNKNCQPRKKMGRKCDLTTKAGKIEAIRFTPQMDENHRPIMENYDLHEDIPEDGGFVLPIPMNMDYIYTNEFGEIEHTNNPNKGVPTSACYRMRFSLSDAGEGRLRQVANYLVPNIREYSNDIDKSYYFGTDYSGYPSNALSLITNSVNGEFVPQDYFYKFTYNKVYTVSSFQNSFFPGSEFKKDSFLGIKELVPSEEEDCHGTHNTPPVNFGVKNYTFTLLIADVLLFLDYLFNLIILLFVNAIARAFQAIGDFFYDLCLDLGSFGSICPFRGIGRFFKKIGYGLAESSQKSLYLVVYPDCVECNNELNPAGNINPVISQLNYCQVGSFEIDGLVNTTLNFTQSTPSTDWIIVHNFDDPSPTVSVTATNSTGGTPTYNVVILDNFTLKITFNSSSTGTATITKNSQVAIRDKQPKNIVYNINNVGQCATTATGITSNADFVARQSNYLISFSGQTYPLNNTEGYFFINQYDNKLYFSDDFGIFPLNQTYSVYILDKNSTSDGYQPPTVQLESGCALYDITYDPTITSLYYLAPNRTPSSTYNPRGGDIVESSKLSDVSKWNLVTNFDGTTYTPITPTGWSEFSNGIFYIIPGSLSSARIVNIMKEYRIRKRIGKMFCGGIVNYSFIDNWLSGTLYFFQFKAKGGKYCGDVVHKTNTDNKFYYKSTLFNSGTGRWGTQFSGGIRLGHSTTFSDLGPRDEFINEICTDPKLDPNCSVARSIDVTSFKDFGELLGFVINYRLEVTQDGYDLSNFFTNGRFSSMGAQNPLNGDILQLISENSEAGILGFDLQNPKYVGYDYEFIQPRYFPELFQVNGQWGPTPINMHFEDDGERIRGCLNEPNRLGDESQPVPFYLWDKGARGFGDGVNQAWDYSAYQLQPLQGMKNPSPYQYTLTGGGNLPADQYLLLPITNTSNGVTISGVNALNVVDFNVVEPFDNHSAYDERYPGFTYLYFTSGTTLTPLLGTLYVRYGTAGTWQTIPWRYDIDIIIPQTEDYYNGTKQILSTPFQFYFGLRHGKTGLDKFIDLFGPKGAFPTVN